MREAVTDLGMTLVPRWRPQRRLSSSDQQHVSTPPRQDRWHLQDLSHSLVLVLCNLGQRLVLRQRAVGRAQAGVSSAVDALGLAVVEQLRRRAVGVELDLVDSGRGLEARGSEKLLEVANAEVLQTGNVNRLLTRLTQMQ